MVGPRETPYEGGLFTLIAAFPEDYPIHGPEIKFMNKIYHLKVDFKDNLGFICHDRLIEWKCEGKVKGFRFYTMKQALFDIFCLFYFKNEEYAVNEQRADVYINNREQYKAEARKWTKLYASIN